MFSLALLLIFCPFVVLSGTGTENTLKLFPERWDGDQYSNATMTVTGKIPGWLDGYFVCQISASYGPYKQPGMGAEHLFDAVTAVASFHVAQGQVTYSARYYPTKQKDIWEYYERDLSKVGVAWDTGFSGMNIKSKKAWDAVPSNGHDYPPPMVDFWKIGKDIAAGTEFYLLGPKFDPLRLDDFQMYPFNETHPIFNDPSVLKMNMPIHARWDSCGTIWNALAVWDTQSQVMQEVVFTVAPDGTRTVEGIYTWGTYDPSLCDNGNYKGNLTEVPGYMHSITSTENYVVLPVSSSPVLWQCSFPARVEGNVKFPPDWRFDPNVPMRFLIFNKRTKEFSMFKGPMSRMPMHQFNAYEDNDGNIIADMLSYDNFDVYNKLARREQMVNDPFPPETRLSRFTIDIKGGSVKENNLTPFEKFAWEFGQYNHAYDEKPYQYGYIVVFPWTVSSAIMKLNFSDTFGTKNLVFEPGPTVAVAEPQFIPAPDPISEDDGILMFRGSDIEKNQTILFFVDGKSFTLKAKAVLSGVVTPLGLHNQFYFSQSLH